MDVLPDNIPVSSDAMLAFSRLSHPESLGSQTDTSQAILETAQLYIEQVLDTIDTIDTKDTHEDDDPMDLLESFLDKYTRLVHSKKHFKLFNRQYDAAKQEITARMRNEPELTITNIDHFKTRTETDDDQLQFSELVEVPINVPQSASRLSSDSHVMFLKHAAFVLKNPTAPIPDEKTSDDDDDDDLEMEGGTIDLRCPITMQLFKDPYISKKCGHIFDITAINSTFGERGNDCPTPGCPKKLVSDDFVRDKLMLLRVKAWKKQEAGRRQTVSYERV